MKKVLVADDRVAGRELVRAVLENSGHQIFEASDGDQALAEALRIHPDLIILDIHMPGLDGFEVMERLRRDASFGSIPIIALTASAMMGDRERAIAAGFTAYLTKPIHLGALRAEVERLLT